MKKFIITSLILFIIVVLKMQGSEPGILQFQDGSRDEKQNQEVKATLKSSSRLFGIKEDITSVILIIPTGSVVSIIGSDSTYYKVKYEESEGYIFKRHAEINAPPQKTVTPAPPQNFKQMEQSADKGQVSRFSYLENKYGTAMAARLISGKVWRGMSSDMVKDSWGSPLKINRAIGEIVKEEWIYKSSWLYLENNILVQWGPTNK
jgi:hypothetical protein